VLRKGESLLARLTCRCKTSDSAAGALLYSSAEWGSPSRVLTGRAFSPRHPEGDT
jgi:hypothetical protein